MTQSPQILSGSLSVTDRTISAIPPKDDGGVTLFNRIKTLIDARIAAIWLHSHEEIRMESALGRMAHNSSFLQKDAPETERLFGNCAIWSLTSGVDGKPGWCQPDGWTSMPDNPPKDYRRGEEIPKDFAPNPAMAAAPHGALLQAISYAKEHPMSPWILIVRDAHMFLKNDAWRRAIKDASRQLRSTMTTIVMLSVESELPPDLKNDVALVRPGLPTKQALLAQVKSTAKQFEITIDCEACADALRGLGIRQATDIMLLDYKEHNGTIDPIRLSQAKAKELASVDGLTFEGESWSIGSVGGLEEYKVWLKQRKNGFSKKAREFGLPTPRGVLFIGIPGCGKTLGARASAGYLGLPLISFNLSSCEGGIVGETASRMMRALDTIDALSPCVALFDEIEKALGQGGERDGGSKQTLLRLLLVWLQDRKSTVFVCFTANDVSGLPPELTRAGRLDETFFVDLPSSKDRQSIIKIHLDKRNRTLPDPTIKSLADSLPGFSGGEIEKAVENALWTAWDRNASPLEADDILEASKAIVPMSLTYAEKIAKLREWAYGRARYASPPEVAPVKPIYKPDSAPTGNLTSNLKDMESW
ncbi:MAG: AAA family ATPase [Candidatus Paceibacterota bacterium]